MKIDNIMNLSKVSQDNSDLDQNNKENELMEIPNNSS